MAGPTSDVGANSVDARLGRQPVAIRVVGFGVQANHRHLVEQRHDRARTVRIAGHRTGHLQERGDRHRRTVLLHREVGSLQSVDRLVALVDHRRVGPDDVDVGDRRLSLPGQEAGRQQRHELRGHGPAQPGGGQACPVASASPFIATASVTDCSPNAGSSAGEAHRASAASDCGCRCPPTTEQR